jgi:putative ABC transport system substrate-binding protein
MRRHAFLFGLALVLSHGSLSHGAYAQKADKMPRVGIVLNSPLTSPAYQAFFQGLHDLGYLENKNIVIIAKSAEGNYERFPELARELAQLNVNVMVVSGEQGLRAAKDATATIPIIVVSCDPLDSLVASIARPGGKATGLTCISSELAGKRLQLLKELVPSLTHVAVLYNPEDRNKESEYKQSQEAARSLKLTLHSYEARSLIEIDRAFARMADDHAQALVIFSDVLTSAYPNQKRLADLALENRLPAIFGFRGFTDMGGLISYGSSQEGMLRGAASYVDKILKGASPGDLPIEQPTRFELVVNLKTAKMLGLDVPATLLTSADEVIE